MRFLILSLVLALLVARGAVKRARVISFQNAATRA